MVFGVRQLHEKRIGLDILRKIGAQGLVLPSKSFMFYNVLTTYSIFGSIT